MTSESAIRKQAESFYDQALDCVARNDGRSAIRHFQQALAIDPEFLDAMHGLVRAFQDSGDYRRAIDTALELIMRDPEDPLAHTSLSILYQHQGRIPEAEAEALKAKLLGWKQQLRTLNGAGSPE
ncbi:tetratricopeptide repeat protein [Acidisarcina polymorpha]|nr:tetratricopeptide repeat protein [Acidisarcina polymorpha]